MPGITSIEIENFRSFPRLSVGGLTPVSLIVGPNNAGKTALLEAIEAVASERSPLSSTAPRSNAASFAGDDELTRITWSWT